MRCALVIPTRNAGAHLDRLLPALVAQRRQPDSILAALVSGLFDHYFSFAVVMIGLFWLLVGINLLEARRLFPERQPQPRAVGYRKLKRQLERGAEA